ncbi:ImmA/IrrE family metallo-endopeptidase [Leuconostoc lactis]|uniref:ImmA/IrrE family metallo-endopeptidase n=1 Tax=Leuconostoc lactis TaxID=1246 RepID=UPI001D104060|nr:ImmA/IrrE family metallo-endopeptidase [Leuconostoc lactis]MCC2745060.1 ImmA/IrrE family metallo-endopeptidase [Leuconostoc lactis]MCC2755597.1 ImmA/IrrE family metallo-endopeptidase [Leuconostoc lactis]
MIKDYLYMQITSSLESLACNNDITLVNAEDLSENVPDTALINTRAVIMNENFDINVDYTYRLAHELSHILYGDHDAQAVYQFSEYGKRGEELLAHRNAIRMLMSIEIPSNPFTFMSYYKVPSWLENDAIRIYNELKAVD